MAYRAQILPLAAGGTNANSASGARTQLGLGTSAVLDVGTGANQVVQLTAGSLLPAVDGSQLTNLAAGNLGVYKQPVRVATVAALPAYTRVANVITADANGDINVAGIDGITDLVNTQRVYLNNGAAGADNGWYDITDIGSAGTPFILTRSTDSDTSGEVLTGATSYINEGTANGGKRVVLTTTGTITLNTTTLVVAIGVTAEQLDLSDVFAFSGNNTFSGTSGFTGTLSANGGLRFKRTATATDYTVLVTDVLIAVTSTAAARAIDLPPAATAATDRVYIVKDESLAAGTNNITLNPDGAELIEGAATYVINTNGGSVAIYTNGTSWFVW